MPTKTGLDAQLGVAKETTWGTPVTVTRFFEFNNESIKRVIDTIKSGGIRAGRLNMDRSGIYGRHKKGASGSIEMEIWNKGFGFWLEHMLGAVATANPSAGVFEHTGSIASLGGKGFTCQVGRPNSADGTVHPFTYEGGKIAAWEIKVDVGGLAICTLECEFEDEVTATALATASYPTTPVLFSFQEASLLVAGGEIKVTDFTVRGDNGLKIDRYYTGGTRREPLEQGRALTVQATADFESLTQYNRFVNSNEVAFQAKFVGGVISGGFNFELRIDAPLVRADGETPVVESKEDLKQPLPLAILDDSLTILYRTSDTTP